MRTFINQLERENELIRIKTFVDPVLEISEVADRFAKQPGGGKALLFENTGTPFPVLINALGSEKRICLALRIAELNELNERIKKLLALFPLQRQSFFSRLKMLPALAKVGGYLPVIKKGKAPCQEVIVRSPDLSLFPVLQCWPADGGRFITLPLVHTRDPENGTRNTGMYRMQIYSSSTTGMHWHKHKTGAVHYEKYKTQGRKMPVAVALGGDPVYTYCATAPLPEGIDEYLLAGFLRNKRVELVKCLTQDIEVPADADIVIEGYIDPMAPLQKEGPFGDHTGFYSLEDEYPVFHVTCITHKKNAIYPATIVGIPPQEDYWLGKATERLFLEPLRQAFLPELVDIDMPAAGTFHNIVIVSIRKRYPGQAIKCIHALWGAGQMMLSKTLIVVDDSVNVHDYKQVIEAVSRHAHPGNDLIISKGPLDVLDHASPTAAFGSKLGIDATRKYPEEKNNETRHGYEQAAAALGHGGFTTYPLSRNMLLIPLNKKKNSVENIVSCLQQSSLSESCFCVVIDDVINIRDKEIIAWLVSSNIDPQRDIRKIQGTAGNVCSLIDGTMKCYPADQFPRPWPNVVVSDNNTIETIDNKWNEMFSFAAFPSPSLRVKSLYFPPGAVAKCK